MRPVFFFLVCPDIYLAKKELARLLLSHPPKCGSWQKNVFWGDEEPEQNFFDQFNTRGLIETWNYLFVHNASDWKIETWKKIDRALAHISPYCWPIFHLNYPWTKAGPKIPASLTKLRCMSFARSKGWIWENEGLNERTLKSYIFSRARELACPVPTQVLNRLALVCPPDAMAVENELSKLTTLFEAGGSFSEEDMRRTLREETDLFAVLQHLERGDLRSVLNDLAGERDLDRIFFTLLVILERELRILWQIKTNCTRNLNPRDVQYKSSKARSLDLSTLSLAMSAVAEADAGVKKGALSVRESLNALLIELADLFAGPRRTPPSFSPS